MSNLVFSRFSGKCRILSSKKGGFELSKDVKFNWQLQPSRLVYLFFGRKHLHDFIFTATFYRRKPDHSFPESLVNTDEEDRKGGQNRLGMMTKCSRFDAMFLGKCSKICTSWARPECVFQNHKILTRPVAFKMQLNIKFWWSPENENFLHFFIALSKVERLAFWFTMIPKISAKTLFQS